MSKADYYDLLGVSKNASDDELKQAYRKKAMQHHPDRNPDDAKSETIFKQVSEAYDVLKDSDKRAAYDRFGHDAFQQGMGNGAGAHGFSDMSDIFEEMFSGFMGGGGRRKGRGQDQRGDDLRFDLELSLEQAYRGKNENLEFYADTECETCSGSGAKSPDDILTCTTCGGHGVVEVSKGFFRMQQECPKCRGKGKTIKNPCGTCKGQGSTKAKRNIKVDIPAGIETGNRIRVVGEGNPGKHGASKGDLYVFVTILPHQIFQRNGKLIGCEIPLSCVQAILGDKITVPTVDGGKLLLDIPAGTQDGQQFRLRGKGMVGLHGRGSAGDMIIEVKLDVPKHISKKQKALLEEFESLNKPSLENKNFWDNVAKFWKNNEKGS